MPPLLCFALSPRNVSNYTMPKTDRAPTRKISISATSLTPPPGTRTVTPTYLLCWDTLSLVITECKRKIKSRTRKVCRRLRVLSAPGSAPYANASFAIAGGACTAKSENSLRQALGQSVFPFTGTMPELLRAWFIYLLRESEG